MHDAMVPAVLVQPLSSKAETMQAATKVAVWEGQYGRAIFCLRKLLSETEFALKSDKERKHIAHTIWGCILAHATDRSMTCLKGPARPARSWYPETRRELLREALRRELKNPRCAGLLTEALKVVDLDIADLCATMFFLGTTDRDMQHLCDADSGPLTDDALRYVQRNLDFYEE